MGTHKSMKTPVTAEFEVVHQHQRAVLLSARLFWHRSTTAGNFPPLGASYLVHEA